tara:strand:+ start:12454 stop:13626 length:1173 start_codon:yes stop_codon:yes gene_type:complete
MEPDAYYLLTLGLLLILALLAEAVGRHTRIPRISLLVLLGFVLGPAALDMIDPRDTPGFDFVAALALSMVGFLVGGKLERKLFRTSGGLILRLSAQQALVTFCVVAFGLWLFSVPLELALLLGAIATATDPAATMEAIRDSGKGGRFVEALTGVVAVDDAWGLILFSISVLCIQLVAAEAVDHAPLLTAAREIFGAAALGIVLGLPMALLSGRIRPGEPTLMEAVGMVMLCAGLAELLHVSPLLACVALGTTVTNLARHHTRSFHAVEEIEWPFLALFFLFSGAYLTVEALGQAGWLLLAYVVLRVLGRLAGSWVSSLGAGRDAPLARRMGLAMLPQAGVAMAMAFQASSLYPQLQDRLLPVVIAAMVLFELAGPVITGRVLTREGAPGR